MSAYLTWKPKSGKQKSLYFDAVTSEVQTIKSTATEHPVERGPNVSDHIRDELDSVTLEVFVSNQPIYDLNGHGGKVVSVEIKTQPYEPPLEATPGSLFNAVGGAIKQGVKALGELIGLGGPSGTSATILMFDEAFDAVGEVVLLLRGIRATKQLVDVVLPSRLYPDMVLTSVEVTRTPATGDGATIALEFKELRQVAVSIVTAPTPTEPRAKSAVKKGAKDTKDAPAPARKGSLLKGLFGKK